MKHTPTPWAYESAPQIGHFIKVPEGLILAKLRENQLDQEETVANAERIVACVNAFEGIEDPQKFMEQRANNGWISVKDAMPEKGKEVFAHFQNIKDKPRVIKAFFINRFSVEAEHFEGDAEYDGHGNAYWPEGWYENNEFEEVHWKVDATITHWMPIPEPPKQ